LLKLYQAASKPCDWALVQQMFNCLWFLLAVAAGWLLSLSSPS